MTSILVLEYTSSVGECKGGKTPQNLGRTHYYDRDCKDRCTITPNCTAYDLPPEFLKECATFTSEGATGDGNKFVTCYMKKTGIY